MSVVGTSSGFKSFSLPSLRIQKIAIAAVAIAIVTIVLSSLAYWVFSSGILNRPSPRNPFLTGTSTTAPSANALGGIILMLQANFYAALTSAIERLKADGVGLMSLAAVGFSYGIFHAAGPGHGKGVISGYIFANRGTALAAVVLSLAAAFLQALVAISLVGVFAVLLNATASTINSAAQIIEVISFAAVAAMGAILIWSKAGEFLTLVNETRGAGERSKIAGTVFIGQPTNQAVHWRVLGGVILAAGIRPCTGAIILLVFSLSQGLFVAGVIGSLAMALGTSITTGTLAGVSIISQSLMARFVLGRGVAGHFIFISLELLAAAFVMVLGISLTVGVWAGGIAGALD